MNFVSGTDFDVVVIGAGLSGLVVAREAQRLGLRAACVEAARSPGGVIATCEREGFRYETAANSTLDNTPSLGRLLDELGLSRERVDVSPAASKRYIVRDGRLQALPASPRELLRTSTLSRSAKLALLREPFIPAAPPEHEETVATFARRRLGQEWLDYVIDPFVSGIHAGDPHELSMRAAFPRVHAIEQRHRSLIRGQFGRARERKRLAKTADTTTTSAPKSFGFRDGMQSLPDALARSLQHLITDNRVEALVRRPDGSFDVRCLRAGEPIAYTARCIVASTPAYAAAALVQRLAPQASQLLATIEYAPIAIVVSAYRRGDVIHPLDGFGFLVPHRERRRILGTLFSSSMFDGRAPADHVLLTTFAGGRRNPGMAAQDRGALVDAVNDELAALLGATTPRWTEVIRWPQAIPQYALGHLERIAAIETAAATIPGLDFCANWRGGISVGDRIESGNAAASRAATYCEASAPRRRT